MEKLKLLHHNYIIYWAEWHWGQLIAIVAINAILTAFDWFNIGNFIAKAFRYTSILERAGASGKAIFLIRAIYWARKSVIKSLLSGYGKKSRSARSLLSYVRRFTW